MPRDLIPKKITGDVLGFFSIVLSYAKSAMTFAPDKSPKTLLSIMPRTNFKTLYMLVANRIAGDLLRTVEHLACYKWVGGALVLCVCSDDVKFCTRTTRGIIVKPKVLARQAFVVTDTSSSSPPDQLTVENWINSIVKPPTRDEPDDLLTTLDERVDGSIGGLGNRLEELLGTTRPAPIWEFRSLDKRTVEEFKPWVQQVEEEVIMWHKKYRNPPG
ncbi:MAG: hypothetical protein Q9227_009547 [Pyrenula ochraceoflavens]